MKEHKPIRVYPFEMPAALRGKIECSGCEKPATGNGHVVHVDAFRNDKGEIKANSHFACSQECVEEVLKQLTVGFSLAGVQNIPTDDING